MSIDIGDYTTTHFNWSETMKALQKPIPILIIGASIFLPGIAHGERVLFIVGNRAFTIDSSPDGTISPPRELQVDRIFIEGGGPAPPSPPVPPPSDIATKSEEISKRLLRSKLEAIALSSVVRRLSESDVKPDKLKEGFDRAIETLSQSSLFTGNKFLQWKTEILALGDLSSSFLKQVNVGLSKAFSLSSSTGGSVIDWMQSSSNDPEVERIDLVTLIELIKLIFQLLKDLGIFNSSLDAMVVPKALPLVATVSRYGRTYR